MMIAAALGPRLATRWSPRAVVRAGLAVLFLAVLGLMLSISPNLASVAFAFSMAGFGAGVGLVISQLSNIVMSSVNETRSSEAGGVQGAAQNLGQSLGTALIGAVLLTGLTTDFLARIEANPAVPASFQQQVKQASEAGLPMVSQAQAESIAQGAGLSAEQVNSVVHDYTDSQVQALKRAVFVASMFALVGLWFARSLPAEPLPSEDESIAAGTDGPESDRGPPAAGPPAVASAAEVPGGDP